MRYTFSGIHEHRMVELIPERVYVRSHDSADVTYTQPFPVHTACAVRQYLLPMTQQIEITLKSRSRGCHLITREIEQALEDIQMPDAGVVHVFIKHTSASLTINENASPDVRRDMEEILNHLVPEDQPYYQHTLEGSDDMPAHAKASLLDMSLTIPVTDGRMNLGTWQGIYLCEHRNRGGGRSLVITVIGD